MATIEQSVQTLEALCRCAISLSMRTQGRPTSDWQLLEGSTIFARNCLTCISLLRLVPISSFYRPLEKLDAWDLASVVSLVRNIVETYHVFFYIIEKVPDAERDARKALWRFHETVERLKALELGVPSSKGIPALRKEYAERRTQLEAQPFFEGLPMKRRTDLLNGRDSKFLTQKEIAERAGVSRRYLASCYKYCSNFTHTSPMSVTMMNAFRAGTSEGEQRFKYTSELATAFMALTVRDFLNVVPDQRSHVDSAVSKTISIWEGTLKDWDAHQ